MNGRTTARIGLLIVLAILGLVALAYRSSFSSFDPDTLRAWFAGFGVWAPVVYVLVYLFAGLVFVPATPLTIAGGVLFGALAGTLYALIAAGCSASVGFLLARYAAPAWIGRDSGARVIRLRQGVEAEGWRFVAFVRLVPIFPFSLINYGLGLTRLHFGMYLTTTVVCMLPGTFAYAYLGDAGAEALGGEGTVRTALIGLALLAVLALLPRLVRRLLNGR
ncbi:MAG TPA: TVP38/TMEM64 family protein [Gammaproteobacteria bacterium]|nr:TVP38/TMEM64 family protein [Gammaproteobacteria bacterium]